MAANQNNKEIIAYLYARQGTWQFCIPYRDTDNRRRQKWVDTRLSIRGNKKNAAKMESAIIAEWGPKLVAHYPQGNVDDSIVITPSDTVHQTLQSTENTDIYQKTLFSDYMFIWLEGAKNYLQVST